MKRSAKILLNLFLVLVVLACVGERIWLGRKLSGIFTALPERPVTAPVRIPGEVGPRGLPPPEMMSPPDMPAVPARSLPATVRVGPSSGKAGSPTEEAGTSSGKAGP